MTKNETNALKLLPTHPAYTASALSGWKHNTSDKYDTAIHGDTTETDVTNGSAAEDPFYYLSDELYIHLDNTAGDDLTAADLVLSKLTVTPSDGTDEGKTLLDTIRVMLVSTDVDDAKHVSVYKADGSHVTTDISADGATPLATEALGTNDPVLASEVNTTKNVKIEVYIYFDGRDENCTSAKYDTDNFAVALEFTADID